MLRSLPASSDDRPCSGCPSLIPYGQMDCLCTPATPSVSAQPETAARDVIPSSNSP